MHPNLNKLGIQPMPLNQAEMPKLQPPIAAGSGAVRADAVRADAVPAARQAVTAGPGSASVSGRCFKW